MIAPQRHEAHKDQTDRFDIFVSFVPLWCMSNLVVVFGMVQQRCFQFDH